MKSTLNIGKLVEMIKKKRGDRGLRATAEDIGDISASTLSRIEQGSLPDIESFVKICSWLGVPTDFFLKKGEEAPKSHQKEIVAQLRADRLLDPATAESLIRMITLAYQEHSSTNNGGSKVKR